MGIDPVTWAIAGVVLSAGGTYMQYRSGQKAAKSQKQAIYYQQQQDKLKQARERRQQIREAKIRTGQLEQTAANQGASNTSAVIGGKASLQSQLSSNLGFLDQSGKIAGRVTDYTYKANVATQNASTWGAVAGMGSTIFQATGSEGIQGIKDKWNSMYYPDNPLDAI